MAKEQEFLTPEQQKTVFQKMKDAGLLSSDIGQSTDNQDQSAQSGVGNVDFSTLQSLIKHAANPSAVPMQEDDNMHPMDAISQIGQQMFGPQKPAGIENTGGPQVKENAPRTGLIPRLFGATTPGLSIPMAVPGIPGLAGIKKNNPVGPNYYQTAKNAGLDKYLPSGLPQMADGSAYVDKDTLDQARMLSMSQSLIKNRQANNQIFGTKDELTAQGVPEDAAAKLMAANPGGVTTREVANFLSSERVGIANTMAQARATMAGVAKLGQALKVGGFDAAQPMAQQADKNLLLVSKAQALVDQIVNQGGKANIRQQAELGRNLAALVATNNGVVTDEGMNSMIPNTAAKKFGGWVEYFTNSQDPIDFSGFLPQMQDLLTREKQANVGISNAASQLGINIMSATGQPNQAATIGAARNRSPVVNPNVPASQSITNPSARPQATQIAPYGPVVTRQGKTYRWNPQAGKYFLGQ